MSPPCTARLLRLSGGTPSLPCALCLQRPPDVSWRSQRAVLGGDFAELGYPGAAVESSSTSSITYVPLRLSLRSLMSLCFWASSSSFPKDE